MKNELVLSYWDFRVYKVPKRGLASPEGTMFTDTMSCQEGLC